MIVTHMEGCSVTQKVRWGKVVTHMEGCGVTQKVR